MNCGWCGKRIFRKNKPILYTARGMNYPQLHYLCKKCDWKVDNDNYWRWWKRFHQPESLKEFKERLGIN